ncbi:hypothetical protein DINM_020753 [Dirofilaria immitis]|nr:hypothetical protein [Dirofilaria immitis]
MTSNRTIVANVFIQVLLFMFLVPNVLPLPLIANLPIRDTSLYDDPPLVDYNFVPYSGMRIDDELLIDEQPFQVDKRKNEFIRFGKRNDLMNDDSDNSDDDDDDKTSAFLEFSLLNDTIGALVTIQLQEYNNPNLALPNGYTCICPSDMQCPYLQDGSITCFFSFTIILSASNQTVQIIESPFVMVPKSSINSGIWTNDNIINMTVKPNTIDIIVHHLGVVINQETGNLEYFNHLTPIDTFAILLDNYQSTPYGTAPNIIQRTIIGQILGTTLQLTYYIQCINNKYGPNCDLKCTPSLYDNTHSVCISIITGMYYSCKYAQDSVKVLDCTLCPYGLVANQTECIISNISSIISENNTSSVFRIWTIVLGCLLGIAIIFIILLVVIFTMVQRRHKMFTANRRRVKSNKTLLPWKNEEWQRSKIKATTRDSGVTSRIATSEERIEDQYIRNNIISTTRRREAHV